MNKYQKIKNGLITIMLYNSELTMGCKFGS